MRRRRKYDEKILQAKPYAVGQYVWVFQNVIPLKGTKKLLKKWRGPFMITEVHQQGRFYRLSTGRAAHYENLKPATRHWKTGVCRETWKDSSAAGVRGKREGHQGEK